MDAGALLRAQGWRGKGFSLHPTNNTIGLSKPLLISRNTDGSGVGKKAHYTSDQWWLHAFDQKLKGLDTSKKGVVTQSVTQGKLDAVASSQPMGKYVGVSGLYSSFVRGGMLDGTVEDTTTTTTTGDSTPATTSEDSEAGSVSRKEKRGESRAERKARRAGKKLRKAEKARRKGAELRAVEKAVAKAAKKEMKRARKASETKEERRARREERRARKESKRKQAGLAQKADQG
jgi:nucleolar protein TMA23